MLLEEALKITGLRTGEGALPIELCSATCLPPSACSIQNLRNPGRSGVELKTTWSILGRFWRNSEACQPRPILAEFGMNSAAIVHFRLVKSGPILGGNRARFGPERPNFMRARANLGQHRWSSLTQFGRFWTSGLLVPIRRRSDVARCCSKLAGPSQMWHKLARLASDPKPQCSPNIHQVSPNIGQIWTTFGQTWAGWPK